jgi:serine/threonine-protein kinase
MAPEVAMGDRVIDGRADLYSLGCTAYFLLTGRMVFDAPTPTAYAIAHVQQTPSPLRERSELPIPAGLEAIVMELLAKSPEQRIASARELARRLRALRDVPSWTPEQAERWWEINLPENTRPAAMVEKETESEAFAHAHTV